MNRLLTLALLVAALLAPASAAGAASRASETHHAAHRARAHRTTAAKRASVDSRNPASTAAAVAERFWGATPCAGQIKIVADSPLVPGLASGTDGWVTFNSSLGADNLNAPASTYTNCTISLAHWQWATPTVARRRPAGLVHVRLKPNLGIHFAPTGRRGHYTVWGAPSVLNDCVEQFDRAS